MIMHYNVQIQRLLFACRKTPIQLVIKSVYTEKHFIRIYRLNFNIMDVWKDQAKYKPVF